MMNYFKKLAQRLEYKLPVRRLEAFCDGVFAIAITLLIIEIHVPHVDVAQEGSGSLARALIAKWPEYFAFCLSFVTVGIYWLNHHALLHMVTRTDHVFGILTLGLLMSLTFLPFPTAVLGEYMLKEHSNSEAVPFYIGTLFIASLMWGLGWAYAQRASLLDPKLDREYIHCMGAKYRLSVFISLALFGISFWSPTLSLVGATIVNLGYVIPVPPPKYTS